MTASIDIDIGGTFTDCYVRTRRARGVVQGAHHRRTTSSQGMSRAIDDAAGRLGPRPDELLAETDIIRYSTTLAMNKLIERKGPRLGLITTEGLRGHAAGRPGAASGPTASRSSEQRNIAGADKPEPLIPKRAHRRRQGARRLRGAA